MGIKVFTIWLTIKHLAVLGSKNVVILRHIFLFFFLKLRSQSHNEINYPQVLLSSVQRFLSTQLVDKSAKTHILEIGVNIFLTCKSGKLNSGQEGRSFLDIFSIMLLFSLLFRKSFSTK